MGGRVQFSPVACSLSLYVSLSLSLSVSGIWHSGSTTFRHATIRCPTFRRQPFSTQAVAKVSTRAKIKSTVKAKAKANRLAKAKATATTAEKTAAKCRVPKCRAPKCRAPGTLDLQGIGWGRGRVTSFTARQEARSAVCGPRGQNFDSKPTQTR